MAEGELPLRLRILWSFRARSMRGLIAWSVVVLSLSAIAATSKVVFDIMRWRDAGHLARAIAADKRAPLADRIDAIVVMQRDGHATVTLLREIELEGGEIAKHAANARRSIEQTRK